MQFPNEIQAALLFDRRVTCLEQIVQDFMKVEGARTGARFNIPEAKPGVFCRLFGGDELMVTLEYVDKPADMAVFEQALGSPVTGILCPEIVARLTCHRSCILINVSHGVLGGVEQDPKIAAFLQQVGMPRAGHSLDQFRRRLDVLSLIARIGCDVGSARVVHWTQSNQLFTVDKFDAAAQMDAPGLLHVHPFLFGDGDRDPAKPRAGIRTFGARHFIGREIVIEPSELPWAANYETILAFLRVATAQGGYVIPHGDTFGPEDRSQSYRVLHRDAQEGDVPLYELVPLMFRQFGFEAEDYVPDDQVIDDRSPPPDLMPRDQEAKQDLANEWREKRAMAEGIGGRFEVRSRDAPPAAPVPPAGPTDGGPVLRGPFAGRRPVFGRKQV